MREIEYWINDQSPDFVLCRYESVSSGLSCLLEKDHPGSHCYNPTLIDENGKYIGDWCAACLSGKHTDCDGIIQLDSTGNGAVCKCVSVRCGLNSPSVVSTRF